MKQIWTKETVIKSAKEFKNISEWAKKFGGVVNTARHKDWMKEASVHMYRPAGTLRFWTKERIIEDAKKYKHKQRWHEESNGAHRAARKLKIFDQVTKHMTFPSRPSTKDPYKWTLEKLRESSLKYSSLYEWRNKENSAYVIASKRNLLEKVTPHMTRLHRFKYWTKDKVKESALKFENKSSWARNDRSAYEAAHKKNWIDELTKHMRPLGSRYKRCIYSIEIKGQKKIYIGLTYNYKRRIRLHLVSKRFQLLAKKYGKQSIKDTQLTNYLPIKEAISNERKFENKYRNTDYEILNIMKTGGLGGGTKKWTKEKIIKDAKKYQSRTGWARKSSGAYAAAHDLKISDQATAHMIRRKNR